MKRFPVFLMFSIVAALLTATRATAAEDPGEFDVLNDRTVWRYTAVYRPRDGKSQEALEFTHRWVRWGQELNGPLPPADWRKPSFDDSGWPMRRAPFFDYYGETRQPGTALICLRTTIWPMEIDFEKVNDVVLRLTYRGGAVVYLDGSEVGRCHMPDADIGLLTPAMAYPLEAFVMPDGRRLLRNVGRRGPPDELKNRYKLRIREGVVHIPVNRLTKGTHEVAIELHRSPLPEDLPGEKDKIGWDTVGLIDAKLTFAGRDVVRQIPRRPRKSKDPWVLHQANPMVHVATAHEVGGETGWVDRRLRFHAPRNGIASVQMCVDRPVKDRLGSGVVMIACKPPDGTIDLDNADRRLPVQVRYAPVTEDFVPLYDDPFATETRQSLWLTVKVPRDAKPGRYEGVFDERGEHDVVPWIIELTVYDWEIGDPPDWKIWVNLLQSPESVAGCYKVPIWSDEHFELMKPTMRLMGECGNDVLGISAVRAHVFGDDPVVMFRKDGDEYVPELKHMRRYLRQYNECAGRPKFLVLHVWTYGMYYRGRGRDGGKEEKRAETIPVYELHGDDRIPIELPIYGKPGTAELWRHVMDGLRECVEELGWPKECILLGTSGDTWPHVDTIRMFKEVAPYAQWRAITHGGGVVRWGVTDEERTQPNGMVVGYCEAVRRITNRRTKVPGHPVCCNTRDLVKIDPFHYRSLPVLNVMNANYDGFCWKGMDYWTYTTAEKTKRSALNTYVRFGNIVGSTPRTIAWPGPRGALPTQQYEMLREGIQDAEAMLFLRGVLEDEEKRKAIGDELAARCERVMEEMLCAYETGGLFSPHGGMDVMHHVSRLYAMAAEVSRAVEAN